MKLIPDHGMLAFSVIILLGFVNFSHQTVYSCDPKAKCGCSPKVAVVNRIVGGEPAPSDTWSWSVHLSIKTTKGSAGCGGSILSSSWVITAAHCVVGKGPSDVAIFIGSTTRDSGTKVQVSQVIVHEKYDAKTHKNDIALLRLASPLSMSNSNVRPICLPSVSSKRLATSEWPPANTKVVAIGWGREVHGGHTISKLRQVTVNTIDRRAETCKPTLYDWHLQLCAGVKGGGKGTCQGDSGGPLMMFTSTKQWVLVGLTSYSIGCAEAKNDGAFTRVVAYTDWIKSHTKGAITTLSLNR